jgi:hypothetical protein
MKKIILMGFALSFILVSYAQDYSKLEKIHLEEKGDYEKQEKQVLECANYLLNSTIKELDDDVNRAYATKFLLAWMTGTPDYTFNISSTMATASKSNSSLLVIYVTAMTKYVLDNKDKSKDDDEVYLQATLIFIQYCEKKENKVKQNKTIKTLIKERDNGTLAEYLKSK